MNDDHITSDGYVTNLEKSHHQIEEKLQYLCIKEEAYHRNIREGYILQKYFRRNSPQNDIVYTFFYQEKDTNVRWSYATYHAYLFTLLTVEYCLIQFYTHLEAAFKKNKKHEYEQFISSTNKNYVTNYVRHKISPLILDFWAAQHCEKNVDNLTSLLSYIMERLEIEKDTLRWNQEHGSMNLMSISKEIQQLDVCCTLCQEGLEGPEMEPV